MNDLCWSGTGCKEGHVFVYSGSRSDGEVPEGAPCLCGRTVASYETCPTCNHRRLIPKPNPHYLGEEKGD